MQKLRQRVMVIRPLEVEKETPCTSANSLSYGKDEQNVSNSQTPDLLFKDAIYRWENGYRIRVGKSVHMK